MAILLAGVAFGLAGSGPNAALGQRTYCYQVAAVNAEGEGPRSNEICATVGTPLIAFQDFVRDVQAAQLYKNWAKANPGELARWQSYRDAVLAQLPIPSAPAMATSFGRALVDAGREALP